MSDPLHLLYSPCPDATTARHIARILLDERLIACANLLPGIQSLYWWEGAITEASEVLLLAKTTPALAGAASDRLESLHPYDCPAIINAPAHANPAFAAWTWAKTQNS